MRILQFALVLATLTAMSRLSSAQVPNRVPVQGYLTDAAGVPIDGPTQVTFRLYDDAGAGAAWYSETQVVQVRAGAFTVFVGAVTPLDVAEFQRSAAFLGVAIAGESEMTPRLEIGTVPFAAYANETASVPPGAVMYFDLDSCPSGWSPLDAARGRALVGVPTGGTRGGTVGTPYGNLENRAHAHTVDAPAAATSSDGAHAHTVDLQPAASSSVAVTHSHSVDPPLTTTTTHTHNHAWSRWDWTNKDWYSFNSAGVEFLALSYSDGLSNASSGQYPFQTLDSNHSLYTDADTHSHSVNIGTFASADSSAASTMHSHSVDLPPTASSMATAHTHTCDPPSVSSGMASATTPYLQLLICRKD